MFKSMALLVMLVAACGGDDGGNVRRDSGTGNGDAEGIDAKLVDAKVVDAPPDAFQAVFTVQCDGSEVETVTTTGGTGVGASFTPSPITIAVGDIVMFTMPSAHDVVPDPTAALTDPGLLVGFNETKCLQFTVAGTYGYKCGPHSFKGSVIVQ